MTIGSHLCWDDSKPSLSSLPGIAEKIKHHGVTLAQLALLGSPPTVTARVLFPKKEDVQGKQAGQWSASPVPAPWLQSKREGVAQKAQQEGAHCTACTPSFCAWVTQPCPPLQAAQILPPHSTRVSAGGL